jgi:hypothetical protein
LEKKSNSWAKLKRLEGVGQIVDCVEINHVNVKCYLQPLDAQCQGLHSRWTRHCNLIIHNACIKATPTWPKLSLLAGSAAQNFVWLFFLLPCGKSFNYLEMARKYSWPSFIERALSLEGDTHCMDHLERQIDNQTERWRYCATKIGGRTCITLHRVILQSIDGVVECWTCQ